MAELDRPLAQNYNKHRFSGRVANGGISGLKKAKPRLMWRCWKIQPCVSRLTPLLVVSGRLQHSHPAPHRLSFGETDQKLFCGWLLLLYTELKLHEKG